MTNQDPHSNINMLPLNSDQIAHLQAVTEDCSPTQLAWLSGYFWGKANETPMLSTSVIQTPTITLLSASQTGNARRLAEKLRDDLLSNHMNVNLINAGDYKFKKIGQEKLLVLVTSTQGEGEPPEEALALHKFLMSKKSPKMEGSAFAVFGLGDTSYEFFSKAGKDFDNRLMELGAERLLERVDADVDYAIQAEEWCKQLIEILKTRVPNSSSSQSVGILKDIHRSQYTKESPLTATFTVNQKITGRHSDKDVRHIEIDLGDSGLRYQPGDALGVWYENDPELVSELLDLLSLKGDAKVSVQNQTLSLAEALQKYYELTVNTPKIVTGYATLSSNGFLKEQCTDKTELQQYSQNTPIIDMIRFFQTKELTPEQLIGLLRPLAPRLYSIASSQSENENEVHITVGAVRYQIEGRSRSGGASSYLIDRLEENAKIRIFVEHNDNFRLPKNPEKSLIMIGSGTGVAPFRAFMQQRDNDSSSGKNWLFFGNPHFTEDFLYQVEWQRYVKDGLLTNIDLAWSRDQKQKVYVQDKIRAKGAEVWSWIQEGAHIYVCGDASHMARDVEQALLDVVSEFGAMNAEVANEFLSELRIERRYQRDVY